MEPLHTRIVPVLAVMVGAAVSAEYLQAYLPETGDALVLVGGLVVLAPLYGGAALLIREVATRTGRGWTGALLMAAAFGLLMTSQVDGSLWLQHDPEISYWDDLREGTLVGTLGFAAYPLVSWVTGHVVFSIGAPLALLGALAPRHRDKPLLGRAGLALVAALCLGAALLIRNDPEYAGGSPSGVQSALSLLAAIGLVALALSPLGRPLGRGPARPRSTPTSWTPTRLLLTAGAALVVLDLLPFTWIGLSLYLVVLAGGAWWVARMSLSPTWGIAHVAALGVACVVERTVVGFVAPLPPGVDLGSKLLQSAVLLGVVVAVSVAAWRRAAASEVESVPSGAVR